MRYYRASMIDLSPRPRLHARMPGHLWGIAVALCSIAWEFVTTGKVAKVAGERESTATR